MNPNRRAILLLYIAALVLMLLFPPTRIETTNHSFTMSGANIHDTSSESGGFRFIGSIGKALYEGSSSTIAMDFGQLFIQILVASLITAAAYAAFKEQKPNPEPTNN